MDRCCPLDQSRHASLTEIAVHDACMHRLPWTWWHRTAGATKQQLENELTVAAAKIASLESQLDSTASGATKEARQLREEIERLTTELARTRQAFFFMAYSIDSAGMVYGL